MNKLNLTQKNIYRAKQFAPFASLRGYDEMILEKQHIIEPRRNMTKDHAELISYKLSQIKPGILVSVTYYDTDSYKTIIGMLSKIDSIRRQITIIKTIIPYDDLWEIE